MRCYVANTPSENSKPFQWSRFIVRLTQASVPRAYVLPSGKRSALHMSPGPAQFQRDRVVSGMAELAQYVVLNEVAEPLSGARSFLVEDGRDHLAE